MTSLYLYALVAERPQPPLGRGLHRMPLRAIRAGSAFAIVEPGESAEATARNIVAHDRVVRRISRQARSILPLRFASVAADRAALQALVAPLGSVLDRAFDRVKDAVQMTLRVAGSAARPIAPRGGPGTRWLAKRVASRSVPEIAPVTEATSPFVRASRAERKVEGKRLVATVYHLVPREHLRAWRRALRRSLPELEDVAITVTGPWPPYAFAELG